MSESKQEASTRIEVMEIPSSAELDLITVVFQDFGNHRGRIIVTCYGEAWTAYWNSMPEETVKEFVMRMDVGYLTNKLGSTRDNKKWQGYLSKLARQAKIHLRAAETIAQEADLVLGGNHEST